MIHVDVHATGPGSCRVTVGGDLDVVSAPTVHDPLRAAISMRLGGVDVDCAQLSFCDCSGLSALLAATRGVKAAEVELRLRAVPHVLARLLQLSHTGTAFTITGTAFTIERADRIVKAAARPCRDEL
ncbi:STAS domain-containing protein [Streptomyces sp. NPDC060028]|uniref:STAS domain-containing protein n=1 Tax=Streptomyces sp. NPDC060028 TaxID=3347041 RepID=UPI0036AEC4B3